MPSVFAHGLPIGLRSGPGATGIAGWSVAGYGMSSHSGSFVTTSCPASPTVDGSVKTISDLRSSATPSPVVTEIPVR